MALSDGLTRICSQLVALVFMLILSLRKYWLFLHGIAFGCPHLIVGIAYAYKYVKLNKRHYHYRDT